MGRGRRQETEAAPIALSRPSDDFSSNQELEVNQPPPNWPAEIEYLSSSCLPSSQLPHAIALTLCTAPSTSSPFHPVQLRKRNLVAIVPITPKTPFVPAYGSSLDHHPAQGQCGLFARCDLEPDTLIVPYLGRAHLSVPPDQDDESQYDASISVSPPASAQEGENDGEVVRCGIDATHCGNEARFVNDYRGILKRPNVFFKEVERPFPREKKAQLSGATSGEEGQQRPLPRKIKGLAIFTGAHPIKAGTELCVSYGKGWWAARSEEQRGSAEQDEE